MKRPNDQSATSGGHTLLELVIVTVLIAILAGVSYFGIFRSVELYTSTTRDHTEIIGEAQIALEKISREIRETAPENIILESESIALVKRTGHGTEGDPSPEVSFTREGSTVRRSSAAGTFDLLGNVTAFTPSRDEASGVVTIDLTLARGDNVINLRTAAAPRQKLPEPPED